MSQKLVIASLVLSACAGTRQDPVTTSSDPLRCPGAPQVASDADFRHTSSSIVAHSGHPSHRGFDLVAPASADPQTLEGWALYGTADKALEDEDVDLYACEDGQWVGVGRARTDDGGHFALDLTGDHRLAPGLRDVYASVVGDGTGTAFLAYVAPDGSPLVVSDVDGTLTSSENEFFETIAYGSLAEVQPGAADAYQQAAAKGYQLVYVTARGNRFTDDTRRWLDSYQFPRGPVRLVNGIAVAPGQATIDYKTSTLIDLASGFTIADGIGNRDSDITAYTNVGIPADHIFIKLPEFQGECQADLDAGKAIGFSDYSQLAGIAF